MNKFMNFTWFVYTLFAVAGLFVCDWLEINFPQYTKYTAAIGITGLVIDNLPSPIRAFFAGFLLSSNWFARTYTSWFGQALVTPDVQQAS